MESSIAVNKVTDKGPQVAFLLLKLIDNAIIYFDQLSVGDRDTFAHAIQALKNRYNNSNNYKKSNLKIEKFIER